jgi:cystathionine beta-lyase
VSKKISEQTALVHSSYTAPEGFSAFPLGVHYASTVLFPTVAAMRARRWQDKGGYTYGLHGTPTTFTLEARLAQIEGGEFCRLAPSGLAAITLVNFAVLKTGDDVLLPENVYGPNREFCHWLETNFGVTARVYDPLIGAGIAALIQDNTRLIWVEAPGSVTMEVPDIPAICKVAHDKSVLVALDNTWAAGIAFNGFAHGVDIVIQALTKYQSGGSDVLMGAVVTRDKELNYAIERAHMLLGYGVSVDDTYLVARSLSSMQARFEMHDKSARAVATWLKNRPEVDLVLHPALADCPGHNIWQRDFTGAAGLFSFVMNPRYTEAQTDRFIEQLQLFKIGFSWGGAHSLCMPYRMQTMRANWPHQGQLIRFNIGLESADDLIADIEQALASLQ